MLACFDSLTRPLNAEWYKKPLHVHDFAPSRMRILNPESEKIVPAESGIFRGFGVRSAAQGIRNPTNDWNPEPNFHWQRLESSTWNPKSTGVESRIQDSLAFPYMGQKKTFIHLCSGPLSLLPTKRCQRPPMIHHPPRPLLLLISAVHLGLLLLHPQDMSILSSLPIDGPQSLTALL